MDLVRLFIKAGVKNQKVVFVMTEAQIPDDRFLVLINDFLASGLKIFFLYFFTWTKCAVCSRRDPRALQRRRD